MFKKTLAVAIISALTMGANAESYQTEVGGTIVKADSDGSDSTRYGLGIKYHFNAVDTSNKPFYEAAFLSRSSNVSASYMRVDADQFEWDILNAAVEFFMPGDLFYIRGDIQRVDGEDDDDTSWSVTGGVTPIDGLLVTTTYYEDTDYNLNLAAKYVTALGGGQFISLRSSYENGDYDDSFSLGGDFYFNRSTSIGIDYAESGDNSDVTFNARHFFKPEFYVGGFYTDADYYNLYGVEAGFRF